MININNNKNKTERNGVINENEFAIKQRIYYIK